MDSKASPEMTVPIFIASMLFRQGHVRSRVLAEGKSPPGLHPWPSPGPLSQGPVPAGTAGDGQPRRSQEGQGHWGTGEEGQWILRRASHMVGFAINFECLCGSIKFPGVVYREYESRKLVAKTGQWAALRHPHKGQGTTVKRGHLATKLLQ